jgi:hypothetical protein
MTATACQTDPQLFDVDRRMTRVDIDYAVDACHNCPALDACRQYLADCDTAGIKVHGIIAGEFRPWPRDGYVLTAAPHGTRAAWNGHRRHREEPCTTCAQLGPPQRKAAS